MWLRQFNVFKISFDFENDLAPHLAEHGLSPCPAHARMSFGWKELTNNEYFQSIQNFGICYFAKEERILPQAVLSHMVETKARQIQDARGFPLKKHEKQQLKQDTEFDLLPKAFCVQKQHIILFDKGRQLMYVQASGQAQIDLMISLIHKTIARSIDIQALSPKDKILSHWQDWLKQPELMPANLQLADKLALIDEDNQQKQLKCQGYNWLEEKAHELLDKGLIPNEMSFIWREMIQFHLSPKLQFKRVQALPSLKEEIEATEIDQEAHDARLTNLLLIGHTYGQMIDDLEVLMEDFA